MNEEPLEVFTAAREPTGIVKPRGAVHRDGDWHLAVFVWIVRSDGQVLLQKRADDKPTYPGRWDASSAGHVGAGEDVRLAAVRELEEELGVVVAVERLEEIRPHSQEHVHDSGLIDREHHVVFLLREDRAVDAYAPGPEVQGLRFATIEEISSGGSDVVPYDDAYLTALRDEVAKRCR